MTFGEFPYGRRVRVAEPRDPEWEWAILLGVWLGLAVSIALYVVIDLGPERVLELLWRRWPL